LLDNGHLLRTGTVRQESFGGPGAGGRIQEFSWDGELVWDFSFSTEQHHPHHDICPMPSGNVLIIAWDRKTPEEAIAAGRHPDTVRGQFLSDCILEVRPTGKTTGEIDGVVVADSPADTDSVSLPSAGTGAVSSRGDSGSGRFGLSIDRASAGGRQTAASGRLAGSGRLLTAVEHLAADLAGRVGDVSNGRESGQAQHLRFPDARPAHVSGQTQFGRDRHIASQERMLRRRGIVPAPRDRIHAAYSLHLERLFAWLDAQPHIRLLHVNYHELIEHPRRIADVVRRFLDDRLELEAMTRVIEPALYRNRFDTANKINHE
jgi:hypothetical protein